MDTRSDLKARLRAEALRLGFDDLGVAAAGPVDETHASALRRWLDAGAHGTMSWMLRRAEERLDVRRIVPGARSVVVLTTYYRHARPVAPAGPRGRVSRYASGRDYHRVVGKRLRKLRAWLGEALPGARVYTEVDTGPILEKAWAERAGLGWIGKHGNLLGTRRSSWSFLAALVTDVELPPDLPHADHCGTCDLCVRACPTAAIVAPGVVDARRCISYHTIEHQGPIPAELRAGHGDWVFGCDDCQEVCPWNRFAEDGGDPAFAPRPEQAAPSLAELLTQGEAAFRARFEGTPLLRAKRAGLARSAAVAAGNLGNAALVPALARALRDDPSPVVRGHAAWALGRIGTPEAIAALREADAAEADGEVSREIRAALAPPDAAS